MPNSSATLSVRPTRASRRSGSIPPAPPVQPRSRPTNSRLWALWLLGTSLLLTLIRRLFGADRHDRRRFDHYYGVRALDDSARKTLQAASACIGCGRCDRVPGLMNLVLSWSRCSSDWDACAHMFADLPAEQVQRQQDRCPASVPLVQLVTLVRSR